MSGHRITIPGLAFALIWAFPGPCIATSASEIALPDERAYPESIAAAPDGTLYVSSLALGGVWRIEPQSATVEQWIKPGAFGSRSIHGVLVDDKASLLWVCSNDISSSGVPGPSSVTGSFVKGFDLASGEGRVSAALPGKTTLCNDMAVGADGSLFVTNSLAPQIFRLRPGSSQLEVWLEDPAFEQPAQGAPGLDGIAFGGDGNLYVGNFAGGAFFRVDVTDGAPGKITKLTPSRPLKNPDGLRSTGGATFVMAEGGGIARLIVEGDRVGVETIKDGVAGPTSVAVAGKTLWTAEGQLPHLFQADKTGPPRLPFRIIGVPMPDEFGRAGHAFSEEKTCPEGDSGLSLPNGFCATVFADRLGHARHLVVAPDGTVYVNSWSGALYGNDTPPPGGFLIALKDTKSTGHADLHARFGPTFAEGAHGGTGIWLYENWLYAEIDDKIVRYALKTGELTPSSEPETILSGMPITGDHAMRPFAIDAQGNLLVSIGSATNACEVRNRVPHSPGSNPCTELDTYGGIWRYDANKTNQVFSPKERYATGIRNAEGLDFDTAGHLFVTQHGRDQLRESWPELYTAKQGSELPAEELVILKQGANYGWPTCYYDGAQRKRVLAPEYGGDGGKKVAHCDQFEEPVAAFPAHWAPNDLKIYKGPSQFPSGYQGGAFIAFHGSWNRTPGPQGGYNVVFQPLSDGKISGDYIVFADGFAGTYKDPERSAYRPSGLAVGPDGALYIADDKVGRVWRVTYLGDPDAKDIQAAPAAAAIHPDGRALRSGVLPVPPGGTSDQVALGEKIFHGEVAGAACAGCHAAGGIGTPVGGDLTSGTWLWGDGSLESITRTITTGVRRPKQHSGAMPPLGGVPLSESELAALAAYVWAIGH